MLALVSQVPAAAQTRVSQVGSLWIAVEPELPGILYPDHETLRVHVRTVGVEPIWVYCGEPANVFHLTLKREDGTEVPSQTGKSQITRSADLRPIRHEEPWNEDLDLHALYGTLAPGYYSAVVDWEAFDHSPKDGETSNRLLRASTRFVVPDATDLARVSAIKIVFPERTGAPPSDKNVVRYPENGSMTATAASFACMLNGLASVRVLGWDPTELHSEADVDRLLRFLISSPHTEMYGAHVWSWGDGAPSLSATFTFADGRTGHLVYWSGFGGYWAFQDAGGAWSWGS
jgi:hypothetical protein